MNHLSVCSYTSCDPAFELGFLQGATFGFENGYLGSKVCMVGVLVSLLLGLLGKQTLALCVCVCLRESILCTWTCFFKIHFCLPSSSYCFCMSLSVSTSNMILQVGTVWQALLIFLVSLDLSVSLSFLLHTWQREPFSVVSVIFTFVIFLYKHCVYFLVDPLFCYPGGDTLDISTLPFNCFCCYKEKRFHVLRRHNCRRINRSIYALGNTAQP